MDLGLLSGSEIISKLKGQNDSKTMMSYCYQLTTNRVVEKDEFQEPYHLAPHSMVRKFISTVQIFNFW